LNENILERDYNLLKTRFNIWKKEKGENKIREQKFPDEHLLRRKTWYIG